MESNEIAVQDTQKDFITDREDAVDLTAWERGVQEEADFNVLPGIPELFAKHGWKQHQMVVVHPYQVIILDIFRNCLCKQAICFCICLPCGLVEGNLSRMVVEKWPEDGV